MDKANENNRRKSDFQVPNLERALLIMEYLLNFPDGKGISDLAKELDFPKNSVFRIMNTLEAYDYIQRDALKKYSLSNKMFAMAYSCSDRKNLIECATETMRELRDKVKETVVISILVDSEGIVLDQVPGVHPFRFVVESGTKQELHTSASIKAILAFSDQKKRDAIIDKADFVKRTEHTITDRAEFLKVLKKIEVTGYALDEGEALDGVCCVAAPIFNASGEPIAALTVTGPSSRVPKEQLPELAETVKLAAGEISSRLGFQDI